METLDLFNHCSSLITIELPLIECKNNVKEINDLTTDEFLFVSMKNIDVIKSGIGNFVIINNNEFELFLTEHADELHKLKFTEHTSLSTINLDEFK
jgi:hypothetical protein